MNINFKTIKFLKKNWLKNITNSGGAQNEVIKNKASTDLIIHCQNQDHGRMWCCMTEDELLENTKKNNGLYEVITTYPHKVYFDIDNDGKPEEGFYNKIVDKITELFPNPDIAISGSITENKTSYHIILNNYLIKSEYLPLHLVVQH